MIPDDALPDHLTRTLGAVIDLHAEGPGRVTITAVAERLHRHRSTVYSRLVHLAELGLVAGVAEERTQVGTIRPLVYVAARG